MLVLGCALLGAAIGALVPRPVYRLSVEYGAPARVDCVRCGHPLPSGARGWVPVGSHCSGCRGRLGPSRWLTVPVATVAFAGLGWAVPPVALPAFGVVAAFGVLLAFVDLACLRLPDPLVASAFVAGFALLGAAAGWLGTGRPLVRGLLAGAALGVLYLVLALLPGDNLGLGDVKLAAVLGVLLGWLGWGAVLLGALLPHLINGPVALTLLLTRRADRRTPVPLGPALLAGTWAAVMLSAVLRGGR